MPRSNEQSESRTVDVMPSDKLGSDSVMDTTENLRETFERIEEKKEQGQEITPKDLEETVENIKTSLDEQTKEFKRRYEPMAIQLGDEAISEMTTTVLNEMEDIKTKTLTEAKTVRNEAGTVVYGEKQRKDTHETPTYQFASTFEKMFPEYNSLPESAETDTEKIQAVIQRVVEKITSTEQEGALKELQDNVLLESAFFYNVSQSDLEQMVKEQPKEYTEPLLEAMGIPQIEIGSKAPFYGEIDETFTDPEREKNKEMYEQANTLTQELSTQRIERLKNDVERLKKKETFTESEEARLATLSSELTNAERHHEIETKMLAKIEGEGYIAEGRNETRLLRLEGMDRPVVYKPAAGEDEHLDRKSMKPGSLYKREWLASQLDKALGLNIVPPTVIADISTQDVPAGMGSMQYWESGKPAQDVTHLQDRVKPSELNKIAFFDQLIENTDRHNRNYNIQPDGKVVAFDNALTFGGEDTVHGTESRPREMQAGEPIGQEILDNINRLLKDGPMMDNLEKSFKLAFGQTEGAKQFERIKQKLEIIDAGLISEKQRIEGPDLTAEMIEEYKRLGYFH